MTPAARLSAAIDVLTAIDAQRVPAADALKDWGTAHRFAGSGDRAAVAGLVFDVLRRRASSAFLLDDDTPRGRMLGMLRLERGLDDEPPSRRCATAGASRRSRSASTSARRSRRERSMPRRRRSRATIRNGSILIWRGCSARRASRRPPRWQAARRSISASIR